MGPLFLRAGITIFWLIAILAPAYADELDDARIAAERKDFKTALELVKPLADAGNPGGMRILGMLYLDGSGVSRDVKEGIRLITAASDAGEAKAQAFLSYMITLHMPELELNQDDEQAFKLAVLSAEQGNSAGQAVAGRALAYAIGTPRNMDQALQLLEKATNQNERIGQAVLGDLLLLGIGIPKDTSRAKVLLDAAAKQINENAYTQSVERMLKHENKLQEWLNGTLRIVDSSPMAAGWNLRLMTQLAKLKRWAELAALVIDVNDSEDLHYYYLALAAEGVGYLKVAQKYYEISLNPRLFGRKCAGVFNNCDGVDVPSESRKRLNNIVLEMREADRLAAIKKAEELEKRRQAEIAAAEELRRQELEKVRLAALAGDGVAQYRLAQPLLTGVQSSGDVELGMKWLRMAAENDVDKAQYELGLRLKIGNEIKKNEAEAERWFKRAAVLGNNDAKVALEEIAEDRRKVAADAEAAAKRKQEAKKAAERKAAEEQAEMDAARKRENTQKLRAL